MAIPAWVSNLAEELAPLAQAQDAAGISRRVKEAAAKHREEPWAITNMIALEWDRLGIIRIPKTISTGRLIR